HRRGLAAVTGAGGRRGVRIRVGIGSGIGIRGALAHLGVAVAAVAVAGARGVAVAGLTAVDERPAAALALAHAASGIRIDRLVAGAGGGIVGAAEQRLDHRVADEGVVTRAAGVVGALAVADRVERHPGEVRVQGLAVLAPGGGRVLDPLAAED